MVWRETNTQTGETIEITPVSKKITTPTSTTTYTKSSTGSGYTATTVNRKTGKTTVVEPTPVQPSPIEPAAPVNTFETLSPQLQHQLIEQGYVPPPSPIEPTTTELTVASITPERVKEIIQEGAPAIYKTIEKLDLAPTVKLATPYVPSNYPLAPIEPSVKKNLTYKQVLDIISARNPKMAELMKNAVTYRGGTTRQNMSLNQFVALHPEINLPKGEYDLVTIRTVTKPGIFGEVSESYIFDYSKAAKHKIAVAGSVSNYDAYLDIVRSHPELPFLHLFAGPLNIDLAFASNKPGITGASEREEILIKQLHSWKGSPESKGDIGRMAKAIIENPFVQIAGAEAIGVPFGKVLGGAEGYIAARWGPKALQAFNLAQIAVGGGLAAPTVYSAGKKIQEGKTGEGVGELTMLGLMFGAGIEGYRIGKGSPIGFGKYKGLTPYEAGAKAGMVKSKRFDPLQKEYFDILSDIKQDLRVRKVMPKQVEPTFENVEALKMYNKNRADVLRTAIKNQLIALKNRAQISGGAGTEKVSTHDIDTLFRSAKDPVVLEYIARKLGMDPNMIFDPHQLPRPGDIITRFGAPKEAPYVYPSGQRGIRLTEQFYRLGESSMELAHKGRVKDIPEAIRVLDLIYSKTGGIPQKMVPKVNRFVEIAAILQQDPRIMDPAMSKLLYDTGISQKLWSVKTKFYRKVLPETYLAKQFNALTTKDLNVLQNFLQFRSGGLPSAFSMPFSSSFGPSGFAAFASGFLGSRPGYPSVSPSAIVSGSISGSRPSGVSGYPSESVSRSGSGSRSGGSRSGSGESGSPVSTYRPGETSAYISSPLKSYVSRPSRSPPSKPSKTYPPSPPVIYYPPPSSDYYPSPYGSISYPTTPVVTPEGLIFPPMGGKVGSKGKVPPYGVKYYNEYEALQKLMQDVIF